MRTIVGVSPALLECSEEIGSVPGRLSRCRLHGRIKRAEKTGAVLVGQWSGSTGICSELPEVPRDLTTCERVPYIRLRPLFAGGGDNARPFLKTARCQRYIGGDAYVDGRDVLRNPVISRVCIIADQHHFHVRGARRPDWSRAIGDNENIEPQASRYAVDFLAHRARITVDIDVSQLPVRFRLNHWTAPRREKASSRPSGSRHRNGCRGTPRSDARCRARSAAARTCGRHRAD